jgi:hypothetical protein
METIILWDVWVLVIVPGGVPVRNLGEFTLVMWAKICKRRAKWEQSHVLGSIIHDSFHMAFCCLFLVPLWIHVLGFMWPNHGSKSTSWSKIHTPIVKIHMTFVQIIKTIMLWNVSGTSLPCEVPVRNLGKLYGVSQNFWEHRNGHNALHRAYSLVQKMRYFFGNYCAQKHDLDKLAIPTHAPCFSLTVLWCS